MRLKMTTEQSMMERRELTEAQIVASQATSDLELRKKDVQRLEVALEQRALALDQLRSTLERDLSAVKVLALLLGGFNERHDSSSGVEPGFGLDLLEGLCCGPQNCSFCDAMHKK
jgi:hypothetical protein